MWFFIGFYVVMTIFIIILAIISITIVDKRYRKNHGNDIPAGFDKTDEIIIDPADGRRLRVYYNSNTGERFYHQENR